MARTIQHKRGLERNLPTLKPGELAFTTDTKKVFVGSDTGNIDITNSVDTSKLATKTELSTVTTQLAETVKEVNGVKPSNGKVTLPIPEIDTSNLIKKNDVLSMANMGQDVKEAMTGGSVPVVGVGSVSDVANLKDKVVTQDKVNFLVSNGNIFNKDAEKKVNGYYSPTGAWVSNSSYFTIFIHVKPNTTYKNNITSKYNLTFWKGNLQFVSSVAADSWTDIVVPNDSNIYYVAVAFQTTQDLSRIMIVEGNLPTNYLPFEYTLDNTVKLGDSQKTDLVTLNKLKTDIISVNRFKKENVITGKELYSDGTYKTQSSSIIADSIDVGGLTDICISGLPSYSDGLSNRSLWFYDANKSPIGTLQIIPRSVTQATFSVPSNAKTVSFSINQRSPTAVVDLDKIQVEEGTSPSPYQSYKVGITKIGDMDFKASFVPKAEPRTKGKKGLFFGDSITETATISEDGLTYTEGTRSNWALFAKSHLGISYRNYARSGASYKDQAITGDIRKSISSQINMAITNSETADIIVVSAGTNDGNSSIGDYTTAMSKTSLIDLDRTKLYEALRWSYWTIRNNFPNAVCFVATPLQRASGEQPQELIDAITRMARRYNFIIIDAHNESGIIRDFEISGGVGRYLSDGLHPNVNGQQLMANLYSSRVLNYFNH